MFARIFRMMHITTVCFLVSSCWSGERPDPRISFSGLGYDRGRICVTHKLHVDQGSPAFQVLSISARDGEGMELPVRSSTGGAGIGYSWSWHVGVDEPPVSTKMVIEARATFGYGEYQIRDMLIKKPREEWFLPDGHTVRAELEILHGWSRVEKESWCRWVHAGGEKQVKQ